MSSQGSKSPIKQLLEPSAKNHTPIYIICYIQVATRVTRAIRPTTEARLPLDRHWELQMRLPSCSPQEYWGKLAVTAEKKEDAGVQAGIEPEREYLTQPPKGYMAPKQTVKATFEAPRQKYDEPASVYHIEQARRGQQND